jgi:sulfur relay protein TusB/DsrH
MADVVSENMSCLHLIAGSDERALEDCLARSLPGDAILFLDAGVLHLLSPRVSEVNRSGRGFLFAAVDLEAHGLLATAEAARATLVKDDDFCRLLAEHAQCLTWT